MANLTANMIIGQSSEHRHQQILNLDHVSLFFINLPYLSFVEYFADISRIC